MAMFPDIDDFCGLYLNPQFRLGMNRLPLLVRYDVSADTRASWATETTGELALVGVLTEMIRFAGVEVNLSCTFQFGKYARVVQMSGHDVRRTP